MRINAVEHHKPDGEVFDDQLAVIERAVAAGLDAVHVTAYASMDVATGPTDSYAPHRVGDLSEYARAVRAAVDVPVITFGRFEPDEAEQALADGRADFVAMGRKLLADPDLPNKLAPGDAARIRPCLYQYRCIGNIFVNESLACVANAATGREDVAGLPGAGATPGACSSSARARPGSRPHGCSRSQGHTVEVRERADAHRRRARRGGRRRSRCSPRYRDWLRDEAELAGVTVVTGADVTVADVRDAGRRRGGRGDRAGVVAARGGRARAACASRPSSATSSPADAAPPATVAIIGGGKPGLTLALALRARGAAVTLIEPTAVFGTELGLPGPLAHGGRRRGRRHHAARRAPTVDRGDADDGRGPVRRRHRSRCPPRS